MTPSHAISIWLEGDKWMLSLDERTIELPAGAAERLHSILLARASARVVAPPLNSVGAPTQEVMDAWKRDRFASETWEEMVRNAGARQRARDEARTRRESERRAKVARQRALLAEADEFFKEIGL